MNYGVRRRRRRRSNERVVLANQKSDKPALVYVCFLLFRFLPFLTVDNLRSLHGDFPNALVKCQTPDPDDGPRRHTVVPRHQS